MNNWHIWKILMMKTKNKHLMTNNLVIIKVKKIWMIKMNNRLDNKDRNKNKYRNLVVQLSILLQAISLIRTLVKCFLPQIGFYLKKANKMMLQYSTKKKVANNVLTKNMHKNKE
jgi:hypothetical protein